MGINKYVYAAGDTSWSDTFMERLEKQSKGYNAITLSNYDATGVCVITDGSAFEMAGSVYLVTTDTSITGSVATGICYIYATGATATASVAWDTANAPVWRDDFQGYYQSAASAIKALGECYFDGSSYYGKYVYPGQTRDLIRKIPIGDWDMDASANVALLHELTIADILALDVLIINDAGTTVYPLNYNTGTCDGYYELNSTQVVLSRTGSGTFDATTYNSTSYNRGWIYIRYMK